MKIGEHYKVTHRTADKPFFVAGRGVVAETIKARFPDTVVYSHSELLHLASAVKGLAAPKHNEVLRQIYLAKKTFPGATVDQFSPGSKKKEEEGK